MDGPSSTSPDYINLRRERDGILSEVADVARRIGPAAVPEWVREQLEEIVNRHQKWREVEFSRLP